MSEKNPRALYGVLFIVFLFFIMLMGFAVYTVKSLRHEAMGLKEWEDGKGRVAVVKIEGVIMESQPTVELLLEAEKDESVKAILIRVDSPGGAVGPTQEIYEEIRRIDSEYERTKGEKGKEVKGKPVYSSIGSIAASGGYYVSAATRKIYANAGSLTGSIGVIMQFVDASELIEWAKVKPEIVKAGRYKDFGGPNRPLTVQERELLENTLSNVHDQFRNDILARRSDRIQGDLNELTQGQIFSGEEAMKLGLVDEIAGLWQAGRKIHEELGLKGEFGLKYIEKKKKGKFWEFLENMEEASSSIKEWATSTKSGVPLYLYKGN